MNNRFLEFLKFDSGTGGWFDCFEILTTMMMILLMLMLGLGFMCSNFQLHIKNHFIRTALCLTSKWPVNFFFWDAMSSQLSCANCRILSLLVNHTEIGRNEVFYDCICDSEGQFMEWKDEAVDQLFWDCEEDGIFDAVALREMLKMERQRVDAAILELGKERLAVASAAEEAMAMILRLQNEKSSVQIEAHNYKKMAEHKMLYQQQTIQSLTVLLLKHQSELRLLEDQLRSCYSQETDQVDKLNTIFSDFTMDDCYHYKSENAVLELYS